MERFRLSADALRSKAPGPAQMCKVHLSVSVKLSTAWDIRGSTGEMGHVLSPQCRSTLAELVCGTREADPCSGKQGIKAIPGAMGHVLSPQCRSTLAELVCGTREADPLLGQAGHKSHSRGNGQGIKAIPGAMGRA